MSLELDNTIGAVHSPLYQKEDNALGLDNIRSQAIE